MFKVGFTYKFKSVADQGDMATHDKANIAVCQAIGNEVFKVMNTDDKYGHVLEFYINGTLYTAGVTPGFNSYTYLIDNEEFKYFEEVKEETMGKAEPQWHVVIVESECVDVCSSFEKASEVATKAKKAYPSSTVEIYARVAVVNTTITIDKE